MMNERDNLSIQLCDAKCERDELMAANVTLAQENSRLRVALQEYADGANWGCYAKVNDVLWDGSESGPAIAREALGLIEA